MAIRIHVKCMSDSIPGNPADRRMAMANLICQYKLDRDFDASRDYLRSVGQYAVDRVRCQFLLDIGPRASKDPTGWSYKWDGKQFHAREVTPPLIWYLTKTYPFHPDPATQKVLTGKELRTACGEEAYRKLVSSRIKQKQRWGLELSLEDTEFLRQAAEDTKITDTS
ncbi:hypothetical protein SODALDRAFT_333627 [Sodiomyces alkalinus F11]|uniref:Uncharacterized protein n=1 Tax=Sodiomyces alkalinus (strain CBS 110278 / VKM F-3762 / F11) TaxID=1314773 RepID=A0A3N2PTP9_SODAK|nr:hypothetical protein SODALDRAFT_333627 [Sodiomyces alkalinus F11]ROT37868.1 hypothetical protein SODALDRAFT_333627 [Sodiomyces alkalinus F11]